MNHFSTCYNCLFTCYYTFLFFICYLYAFYYFIYLSFIYLYLFYFFTCNLTYFFTCNLNFPRFSCGGSSMESSLDPEVTLTFCFSLLVWGQNNAWLAQRCWNKFVVFPPCLYTLLQMLQRAVTLLSFLKYCHAVLGCFDLLNIK